MAAAPRLIAFNKPYGVLSQFTPEGRWAGLKDYIALPGVYVAGRLDADSEGLLLLTSDGALQARISDPRHKMEKTYWVQVEGEPDEAALEALRRGVQLNDGPTRPARARRIDAPCRVVGTHAPGALSPVHSHLLDRADHPRRPQPPGPAHDRRRGLPHAAPGARCYRPLHARWPGTGQLAGAGGTGLG